MRKNYTHYKEPEDFRRVNFIQDNIEKYCGVNAKVLDIGCGTGNVSLQLAGSGHQVIGLDLSEESVKIAQTRNIFPNNLRFMVRPAEELEGLESFDAIVLCEVIEHLYQPKPVLETALRLLNPNGVLIITTPNGWGPRELFVTRPYQALSKGPFGSIINGLKSLLGYKGVTVQSVNSDLTHVQFFTYGYLDGLFTSLGLEILQFKPVAFIQKVFPFSLFFRNSTKMQEWDCSNAEKLPKSFASGFAFALRRK